MLKLDYWQKEYIDTDNDKVLVSGRQTGKSEAAAYDAAQFALKNPKTQTLIISKTERQAQELLVKTLNFLHDIDESKIATGKDRPTMSKITLKNKSKIMSLPTGMAGEGIRYLTIHKLIADEAQLIPDDVFTAVTPMLLTTGGTISLLGTPLGKSGYFWKAYENSLKQFEVFHVNSEKVINERPISKTWPQWRKDAALNHLSREKQRMSEKQYAQEYLGIFVEDLNQFFSDELIKKCCILKRNPEAVLDNFMGVDLARMGNDRIVYTVLHKFRDDNIHQIENIIKIKQYLTKTEQDIIQLSQRFKLNKIGIDAGSGSLGVGIFDRLLINHLTKRKIIPMNNRQVSLDRDGQHKQRIFKEDMYDNLLSMMEKGEIKLLDDDEVTTSLKSVQLELVDDARFTRVRIFSNPHNLSDVTEALIRAAWLAQKEKILKFRIHYI